MSNVPADAPTGAAAAIPRSAWRTLAITSAVVFMVSLEITVIALALPEIRDAFPEASDSSLSWILTVYNIGVASLLLLSGWWADKSGRKKVFLIGLTFFAIGSVIAALAPNIELLIAARAIQSIGGAIQYPAGLALLLPAFPAERRQMAIGIWGAMGALAAALGPSVGAVLVNALGWRSIFGINVPVAILAIIVGRKWLDESRGEVPEGRVDMIGVPLGSLGVGAIILGIVQASEWGPGSPAQVITIVTGIAMLGAFIVRSRTHPVPLFDLGLLKLRSFSAPLDECNTVRTQDRSRQFINLRDLVEGASEEGPGFTEVRQIDNGADTNRAAQLHPFLLPEGPQSQMASGRMTNRHHPIKIERLVRSDN